MNFTYFKFLFINTIKRKPVWITWLLFLFTCTCFIIILPLAAKMNTLQVWANTTMTICQTFLGMTAALFTAVLAINIFKDTNEEGTELIVISKPISRMNIVLTKFLLYGLFCIVVNLSAVIISMFTVFLPRTEPRFYWGLVISMLIGNAVTFGVFGSIAILMSVNFAKVGIIITNIVLSLVFLIYQALTLVIYPVPSKALTDSKVAAPSYILMDRQKDGSYKETEVVRFSIANLDDIRQGKEVACTPTNWKEMKQFWDEDIMGKNPAPVVNATDLASQISLTYLSYGIDDYARRQAQRMFALSRYYNCELTSPASPEIIGGVENKKTLPWLYTGFNELEIPLEELGITISLYLPQSFGYAGIKPITTTRLRGYTDNIPIGYTRSKEIGSQKEVYFEQEQWNRYSKPFDLMYSRIFNYELYKDLIPDFSDWDFSDYDSAFAYNNDTIKKYYQIVWNSLMGKDESVLKNADGSYEYNASSFDITTVDDLNERFIQFKNYCYYKALEEQQKLLNNEPVAEHKEAWEYVKDSLQQTADTLSLNISYKNWMIQARDGDYYTILEPNTQTVSYQLILNEWQYLSSLGGLTIPVGQSSAKSIMQKTAHIFHSVCGTNEKYLFDSITSPSRSARITGETHMVEDDWIPYPISLIIPMGHNLQYFFYEIHPVVEYWYYAVLWGSISLALFATGAIVYNKYDVK